MEQFGKKCDIITLLYSGAPLMKKYLLILLSLSSLLTMQLSAEEASTQMYASDIVISDTEQYGFGGITIGSLDLLDQVAVAGVRFGMQNSTWRTMFTFEADSDSYRAFLIEADRTIVAGLLGGKGRIYIGASGGWIEFYGEKMIAGQLLDFEDYGYAYGGNIGFMFYLSDRVDMSIDYRYLLTSGSCTYDSIQGPSISLHYFF